MSDTLTQEEIDALRDAVKSGKIEDEGSEDIVSREMDVEQVKVVSYDFRKPQLISSEQLHTLQMLHETAAKSLQSMFVSVLKMTPDVRLVAMDQISYSEFVLSMTNPTFLAGLAMNEEMGRVALEIAPPIAPAFLDIMLGGDGQNISQDEPHEFSALEMEIMRGLSERIVEELGILWKSLYAVTYEIFNQETNPEYLQLCAPDTPCLCATLDIHIGETGGVINICYPFVTLQNVLQKGEESKDKITGVDSGDRKNIMRAVENVPLPAHVIVGTTVLSAGDICELEAGDVLILDRMVGKPLSLAIANRNAFSVDAGKFKGRLAVCLKGDAAAAK